MVFPRFPVSESSSLLRLNNRVRRSSLSLPCALLYPTKHFRGTFKTVIVSLRTAVESRLAGGFRDSILFCWLACAGRRTGRRLYRVGAGPAICSIAAAVDSAGGPLR